ncbi:hypothetical protein [Deinococcus multiflagellatus]|uniref:Uncharacterized protein n=1 Tax=Deinococcus multiflagellatus TaxID=1656887 RepID=A0ABW1ZUF7_9DEIO
MNNSSCTPQHGDTPGFKAWQADLEQVREESRAVRRAQNSAQAQDQTHAQIQGWLRDLGLALGFEVWIAANDRSRPYGHGRLSDGCLETLPPGMAGTAGADAVRLIDVVWFERATLSPAAAFEVEHTTSIYSGIVRLLDLALGAPERAVNGLYLVAPDSREADVREQIQRPAFQAVSHLHMRYLPYSE